MLKFTNSYRLKVNWIRSSEANEMLSVYRLDREAELLELCSP